MKIQIKFILILLLITGKSNAQEITLYDYASIERIGHIETNDQYLIMYENGDMDIIDSLGNKIQNITSNSKYYNFEIHETKNSIFIINGSTVEFISNGKSIKREFPEIVGQTFPLYDSMLLSFKQNQIQILTPNRLILGKNNNISNIVTIINDSLIYEYITNTQINEYKLKINQLNYTITFNKTINLAYNDLGRSISFFTNNYYPHKDLFMHKLSEDSSGTYHHDSIYKLNINNFQFIVENPFPNIYEEKRTYLEINGQLYYVSEINKDCLHGKDSVKYYKWENGFWINTYETPYNKGDFFDHPHDHITSNSYLKLFISNTNNRIGFTNALSNKFLEIKDFNKPSSLFTRASGFYEIEEPTIFSAFNNQYLLLPHYSATNQEESFLLLDENDRKIIQLPSSNCNEHSFACYNADTTLVLSSNKLIYKLYQNNNKFIVDTIHWSYNNNSTGIRLGIYDDFKSTQDLIKLTDSLYLGTLYGETIIMNTKLKEINDKVDFFPSFINENYQIVNYHNANKDEICILVSDGSNQYVFHGSSNKLSYFNFDNFQIYSAFKYNEDFFLVYNKGICKINNKNGSLDYYSNFNLPDFPSELGEDAEFIIYNNDSLIFIASGLPGTNEIMYFDLKSNQWAKILLTPPHSNILQLRYANGKLYAHTANLSWDYTKSYLQYSAIKNPTFNNIQEYSFTKNQINPCSGNCIIFNSDFKNLRLINTSGKTVLSTDVDYVNYTLNTLNIANGMYILELHSPNYEKKETKILWVLN